MKNSKRLLALAVAAACGAPMAAYATNGMNLEGYGPIATGMGGASMAYDNGTAAMMNNPATLGLMTEGSRLDVALGVLGPNIDAQSGPMSWSSSADSFLMPAIGWMKKSGQLTYGVGAFAQGGMGAQYNNGGPGTLGSQMLGSTPDWRERSEVGVMRILFPLAYDVNEKFNVGGSIDYVRATMDLQMAMPGDIMNAMAGAGLITGSMTALLPGFDGGVFGGYFNFSDNNDYNGKAEGSGFAGKLGFTYKVNDQLTLGGTYHSKTSLGDLEGNGSVTLAGNATGPGDVVVPVTGKFKIVDFEWPETYGLGFAYQANDKLMVAGDVKIIRWADVMKNFKMTFNADATQADPLADAFGTGGTDLAATLPQNWDDQTVFALGMGYQVTDAFVVRVGANIAKNPVPNTTVHYLFPAIVENHYTAGFGYKVSNAGDVNFSLTYAPEVAVTGTGDANTGLKITHAQTNWQLMYSHRF